MIKYVGRTMANSSQSPTVSHAIATEHVPRRRRVNKKAVTWFSILIFLVFGAPLIPDLWKGFTDVTPFEEDFEKLRTVIDPTIYALSIDATGSYDCGRFYSRVNRSMFPNGEVYVINVAYTITEGGHVFGLRKSDDNDNSAILELIQMDTQACKKYGR